MFNALIKTHHITSRKKIAKLKSAFSALNVRYALIRSGGCPGLMYVEGHEEAVREWVAAVKALKYKDYNLLCRPALVERNQDLPGVSDTFMEEYSVRGFATRMDERGMLPWWRRAMGFSSA